MKKFISLLLIVVLVLTLGACTTNADLDDNQVGDPIENIEDNEIIEGNEDQTEGNNEDEIVDPAPKTDSQEVSLYFGNKEYIETGDEDLEHLIVEERVVEYGDISLEEAIVRELMKGPESDELSSSIPSTAKLLGVEVSDGTAYVNFAGEGMYGGSLQESFTISQIVESLLELDSVNRVQFLIDGQKADTLMGHYTIDEPFE